MALWKKAAQKRGRVENSEDLSTNEQSQPSQNTSEDIITSCSPTRFNQLQSISMILLVLIITTFLVVKCLVRPEISFIIRTSETPWIMPPTPVSTRTSLVEPGSLPVISFFKEFHLQQVPPRVVVNVRAMREFNLFINDKSVYDSTQSALYTWKTTSRIDITPYLTKSENKIRADVRNPRGIPLLSLVIKGLPETLKTDDTWHVQLESGQARQAVLAEDTKILAEATTVPSAMESLYREKVFLIIVFLISGGIFLVYNNLYKDRFKAFMPWIVLCGTALLWVGPLAMKALHLPAKTGYDSSGHINYILFILYNHAIPVATDGWIMCHPPFYYLLAAGLIKIIGNSPNALQDITLARIITFICGLAHLLIVYLLVRKMFRGNTARIALATFMAGIIPMNIYISMYISNESPFAFFAALSILGTVYLLMSPGNNLWMVFITGVFMGIAFLTKFTAVILIPLACFFIWMKILLIDGKRLHEATGVVLLLVVVIFSISGWHYIHNFLVFGRPFVNNWNLPEKSAILLQWPTFHTLNYFTSFGESLHHPYFSGFYSFWDAIYSTLWGDGYIAGRNTLKFRLAAWNYNFMSATYILAFPATVMGGIGMIRSLKMARRSSDLLIRHTMFFFLALTFAVISAMMYFKLMVPVYSTIKAFFGLMLLGPMAVFLSLGFEYAESRLLSKRLLIFRAALYGWLGTLAATVYMSYIG